MSVTQATTSTSAPTRQAADQSTATPPTAGAQGAGSTNGSASQTQPKDKGVATAKPKPSILGDISDPQPQEKKAEGSKSQQGEGGEAGGSQEGKPGDAAKLEIKLPEDMKGKVDEAALQDYATAFSEMGIADGELASKLVAADIQRQAKLAEAQVAAWDQQDETWRKQLEEDADFGGKALPQTVLDAKKILRRFGGEPAAKALMALGAGNHPELVKMLARIGRALKEDVSDVGSGDNAPPGKDAKQELRELYPSMFNADGTPKT